MDWDEISAIIFDRRAAQTPLIRRMVEVRDRYNGEYVVPIPVEGDDAPLPPMTAQIIADAIDNMAMRAGSVMPSIHSPAIDPGKATGVKSSEFAQIRQKALGYTYGQSYLPVTLRRSFRQLGGYGTACFEVVVDDRTSEPRIVSRDPLMTFPEPRDPGDLTPIEDCAFIYGKSLSWLHSRYPTSVKMTGPAMSNRGRGQEAWDLVEWVDADHIVIGLLGPQSETTIWGGPPSAKSMELTRFPNKAGICPAVTGDRVTLDRLANQLANIIGQTDMMARLQALEIRGVERSIWPDTYLVGRPGETPVLLGGAWQEGTTGNVNLLTGVDSVGQLRGTPDPRAAQTIDRLERNARVSSGLVPAMGGETYGALRTGRGIDSMMGAAVDPRVQEMQEVVGALLEQVNEVVLETYKGYWGGHRYVGFSKWPSDRLVVDFEPNKHFETTISAVTYPIPGADVQSTTVLLGQLYGTKAISLQTLRSLHPYVADADAEDSRTRIEAIDDAIFASLLQRFTEGGIPPIDQATIKRLVAQGKPIEVAIETADRQAQERQASSPGPAAPPLGPDGAPVPGAPPGPGPEAMPGLANPGEGAGAGAPAAMGPDAIAAPQGLHGFQQLSSALNMPQMGMSGDQMTGG